MSDILNQLRDIAARLHRSGTAAIEIDRDVLFALLEGMADTEQQILGLQTQVRKISQTIAAADLSAEELEELELARKELPHHWCGDRDSHERALAVLDKLIAAHRSGK